jgi:mRNA-degrading endonuclease RelE of RelBE toxin-antitoxin system
LPKQQQHIAEKINSLAINPYPIDAKKLSVTKRINDKNYHRIKSNNFRIIYHIENLNELIIDVIEKRNDAKVYEIFKRLN